MNSMVEETRLAALHSYQVLDGPRPAMLDGLTGVAAGLFGTPMAAVSLVDRERQWFAGNTGLADAQTPRSVSFCAHTLPDKQLLVVPDARLDQRFSAYGNVIGAPRIRFYAGAPIVDEDGHALGAVCVIDDQPRDGASDRMLDQLTALAAQAAGHFALIRSRLLLAGLGGDLARAEQREVDLVASITHELRTPVASIQGYLELLCDNADPALAAQLIDPIQRNGQRLIAMVDHLLAGTRSPNPPPPMVRTHLDLRSLAQAAIDQHSSLAADHQIALELHLGEPVPATADAVQLGSALTQVIRNAVLFTRPGGHVTVTVTGGARPTLVVADDGVGIPADELPHVFGRFYRGRYARQQAVAGMGLGLTRARQALAAHGGHLHLDSNHHGTTATITLSAQGH